MARLLARVGTRCQEHPHRPYEDRCDRCGLPYCDECLLPSERDAHGARSWFCTRCVALMDERTRRRLAESALAHRAARAAARARRVGIATTTVALVLALTGVSAFAVARRVGTASDQALPERAAACGDLSRIRSIGAIGTQAGEDAINVLAYPHRADVQLSAGAAGTGAASTETLAGLVDECDAGWRHEAPIALPATVVLDTKRQGSYVQRFALWQDPRAPRDSWVRDFELLASATDAGDDFVRLTLDRPAELVESTEAQWFEIVQPAVPGRGSFPQIAELRRLQIRILTTVGAAREGVRPGTPAEVGHVALGEVAAFGPDVELVIDHPASEGVKDRSAFTLRPGTVNALAGQPKFLLFINRTTTAEAHHFVSVGLQQNLNVRIAPDEVKSGLFVAGRPGRYEFVCTTPGHALLGLSGTIVVR